MVDNGSLDPFLSDGETSGPSEQGALPYQKPMEPMGSLQSINEHHSVLLRAAVKLLLHFQTAFALFVCLF